MEFNTLWSNKKDIFQTNLENGGIPIYQSHYDNLHSVNFDYIWKNHKVIFGGVLDTGLDKYLQDELVIKQEKEQSIADKILKNILSDVLLHKLETKINGIQDIQHYITNELNAITFIETQKMNNKEKIKFMEYLGFEPY